MPDLAVDLRLQPLANRQPGRIVARRIDAQAGRQPPQRLAIAGAGGIELALCEQALQVSYDLHGRNSSQENTPLQRYRTGQSNSLDGYVKSAAFLHLVTAGNPAYLC